MTDPTMKRFFGYGSLVNRHTHDYPDAVPATVRNWRRVWRATAISRTAFLTAEPAPSVEIDGLSAGVPGDDWAALDLRETGYLRVALPEGPQIYHIPTGLHARPEAPRPILLSYLDVVVQGFLREFGEDGVARFFETTAGWDTPISDDRAAPRYPRARKLTAEETALVDHWRLRVAE